MFRLGLGKIDRNNVVIVINFKTPRMAAFEFRLLSEVFRITFNESERIQAQYDFIETDEVWAFKFNYWAMVKQMIAAYEATVWQDRRFERFLNTLVQRSYVNEPINESENLHWSDVTCGRTGVTFLGKPNCFYRHCFFFHMPQFPKQDSPPYIFVTYGQDKNKIMMTVKWESLNLPLISDNEEIEFCGFKRITLDEKSMLQEIFFEHFCIYLHLHRLHKWWMCK